MRDLDDKIIYALNTSIPTESFKGQVDPTATCTELHEKLKSTYSYRQEAIKKCIVTSADTVKTLKEEREVNRDDIQLNKKFKTEQRKVSCKVERYCIKKSTNNKHANYLKKIKDQS